LKLVDVTLRDGGHQLGFAWPLEFVRDYLAIMLDISQIDFIEIGYWKQSGKFDGRFYSVDEELLELLAPGDSRKIGIMIDFHYCNKSLDAYPSGEGLAPGLIRLTSRKEDFERALDFLGKLKRHTGALTSLNIFNISNYSRLEILRAINLAATKPPDFIYFADTHGSVDLEDRGAEFAEYARRITDIGSEPGFHLHNHTGKAFFNYRLLGELGYTITDGSINGLGKGLGNLALEHVVAGGEKIEILELWRQYDSLFEMPTSPFGVVTGTFSTADHYADQAVQLGLDIRSFGSFVERLEVSQKDNYDRNAMLRYLNESTGNGDQ